jgi:hypothetical protein
VGRLASEKIVCQPDKFEMIVDKCEKESHRLVTPAAAAHGAFRLHLRRIVRLLCCGTRRIPVRIGVRRVCACVMRVWVVRAARTASFELN